MTHSDVYPNEGDIFIKALAVLSANGTAIVEARKERKCRQKELTKGT